MDLATLLSTSPALFAGVVFLFSLLIGSFLNVVIYRLPLIQERQWRADAALAAGEEPPPETERFNLIVPRSRCPSCGHQITALQNIPVVSYLVLRGRCASCGARIGVRYPTVELATATLSAIVALRFGFGWETAAALVITWYLIALTVIDIDEQLLPDALTLPLLWLGLLASLAHPLPDTQTLFIAPREAIVGAAAGYLSLWTVYQLFRLLTGKEGMGYGDFKLLAALGAWLGWQMLPLIVILSAGVGAVVGIAMIAVARHERGAPMSFGPYLAAAGWIAMLFGEDIVGAYLALFAR